MKDEEFIIEDGPFVLIPPGEYTAKVVKTHKLTKFNRPMMRMQFQIVSMDKFNGVRLEAWLPLGEGGKLRKGSKLVRWYLILEEWGRKDRVSLKAFRHRLLQVTVRTVEKDYRQKPLHEKLQYSVVDDVLGSVGLLAMNADEESTA